MERSKREGERSGCRAVYGRIYHTELTYGATIAALPPALTPRPRSRLGDLLCRGHGRAVLSSTPHSLGVARTNLTPVTTSRVYVMYIISEITPKYRSNTNSVEL